MEPISNGYRALFRRIVPAGKFPGSWSIESHLASLLNDDMVGRQRLYYPSNHYFLKCQLRKPQDPEEIEFRFFPDCRLSLEPGSFYPSPSPSCFAAPVMP
jgi:hypothetical protein